MGKSEVASVFGVNLSSVKRCVWMAREGKPLASKKRLGSKPKLDEEALGGGRGGKSLRHTLQEA